MSESKLSKQFFLNDSLVNFETGEIQTDGKVVVVEPKVMALLEVFSQKPHQVLSAEMLLLMFGHKLFSVLIQFAEILLC